MLIIIMILIVVIPCAPEDVMTNPALTALGNSRLLYLSDQPRRPASGARDGISVDEVPEVRARSWQAKGYAVERCDKPFHLYSSRATVSH